MTAPPNILFFSRSVYTQLFPKLVSETYNSFHATVNLKEKKEVAALGGTVVGCLEEEFAQLEVAPIPQNFLQSSFQADRFLGWLTIPERQEILGKTISFWQRILNERSYLAGVHETIAIEQEEVFSVMLKSKNILDLNFLMSAVPERFMWKPSPYSSSYPKEMLLNTPITNENLALAKEIIAHTKQKGHKPSFAANPPKRKQKSNLRHLLSKSKHSLKSQLGLVKKYTREEKKRDSIFYYNQLNTHFDYHQFIQSTYPPVADYDHLEDFKSQEKYFFPFHYEPEATLLYFNPDVAEQINVIQQIAKQLPLNAVLVIKEHPYQPGYFMQDDFQELKRKNSNLALLPAEQDSYQILKQIKAVITISGSVGWEAIINNIPVMVLGNVFYDQHPDVHKIKEFSQIRGLLSNHDLKTPQDQPTIEYLAKFIAHTYAGYPSDVKRYNDPQNIRNMISSIEQKINQSQSALFQNN